MTRYNKKSVTVITDGGQLERGAWTLRKTSSGDSTETHNAKVIQLRKE